MTVRGLAPGQAPSRLERLRAPTRAVVALLERVPHEAIALLARLSIAGLFWRSGQTKIEGFALDPLLGRFELGWPRLGPFTVDLFRDEYKVPLLSPELAALAAASAEHLFPILLVLGLATRFAALALLAMTAVIQLFVYPDAWPTHGTWAVSLLYLTARGPGRLSLDHRLLARRST
jgi:putative oxidoreductase